MAISIPTQLVVSFVQPRLDDTQQRLDFKIASLLYAGQGLAGVDIISDSAVHSNPPIQSAPWWIFHAITACVIANVTYAPGTSTGSLSGVTLSAGDRIYGNILSLQLTSGTGELYRAAIQT